MFLHRKTPDFHIWTKWERHHRIKVGPVVAPSLFATTSYIQEKFDTDFIHVERLYFKNCPNILTFVPSEHII